MKASVTCFVLVCSVLAIFINIAGVAAANIDNPKIDHAEIDVSQPVQGLGGPISIATYVQVNGTCWQSWEVSVEITLTVPEGLILQEATTAPAFSKKVYLASNIQTLAPLDITVNRLSSTSYAFDVAVQLLLGEVITLHSDWTVKGQVAGIYNLTVLASSNDPNIDPRFRSSEGAREVQIVEGSPSMGEIVISPVYNPPFDPQTMYVSPGQAVQVRCNVTCLAEISTVALYYSVDSSGIWNQSDMAKDSENEWMGTLPAQSEGKEIILYVEAFSALDRSAKTKEYTLVVSDLQTLELRTTVATAATITSIVVGCVLIFVWKRRKVIEVL